MHSYLWEVGSVPGYQELKLEQFLYANHLLVIPVFESLKSKELYSSRLYFSNTLTPKSQWFNSLAWLTWTLLGMQKS